MRVDAPVLRHPAFIPDQSDFQVERDEAKLGRAERLFLGFAFLVVQGAFVGMSSGAAGDGAADGSDSRHMIAFALLLLGTAAFGVRHISAMRAGVAANLVYFILPAIIVASTLWSVAPLLTLKRSVLTTGVCVFDLYVAVAIGLDRLLRIISTTIFISAVASVFVALALPAIGREIMEGLNGDWRGVFPQKNILGHVMSIGAFIELFLMIRAHRLRAGPLMKFALCFFLVIMARSASSLLSVVLATLLSAVYVCFRRGPTSGAVCLMVACGAFAFIGGALGDDATAVFNLLDRDPSLTGRTELWDYVTDFIEERPIGGWGYMAFWMLDSQNVLYIQHQIRWNAPNAHNGYLELVLSNGLIGLAGLLVMGLWSLRRAFAGLGRPDDLGALLLIILVQLLVANLTESFVIGASVFGWNIFSIIVLKAGLRPAPRDEEDPAPRSILGRAKIIA